MKVEEEDLLELEYMKLLNADYIISAIGQIPDESVWNAKVIETDHGLY